MKKEIAGRARSEPTFQQSRKRRTRNPRAVHQGDSNRPSVTSALRIQELPLKDDHRLVVVDGTLLKVLAIDGQVQLCIQITPAGPVLRADGCSVLIQATGTLALNADRVLLHGRNGLALSSGGDLAFHAAGQLESTASVQRINATLGNVDIKANDDVKLKGERIKMNCD